MVDKNATSARSRPRERSNHAAQLHRMNREWSAACGLLLLLAACAPATGAPADAKAAPDTPTVYYRAPTYGEITPGAKRYLGDLSTTIDVPPFPYSGRLAPAEPSVLDGLYAKAVPLEGTPTPCKRCAGYRREGGVWTIYFDRGVYKVFQQDTEFQA